MKRKKILLTVTNDLTYDQRMIRIGTSLSNAGYEVQLIGRKRINSIPLTDYNFAQKRINCLFDKGKFFYLEYNIRLFFYLLFHTFDVVCSIDLDTILAGYWTAKLKGKVCVYDAHEYFTEVPEVIERPMTKRIWEWVANHTIPNLTYCYTVCESLSEVFLEKYGTSFEVIRNVPFKKDTNAETTIKEIPPVLLYQGVLNDGRGLEEIIQAMCQIDQAQVWLAGEGDLSQELRDLVRSKQLENKVIFLGYQRPADLVSITQKASIGLNLLKNKGLNYYYSLANKAFDYIQADMPAIHMNFPEYQKINQTFEVSILLNDLQTNTIVGAVNQLLNTPSIYQKLQNNCAKAKLVFVWEEEEKKLLSFYQNIFDPLA